MHPVRAILLLVVGSVVSLHAFEVNLGPALLGEAIALGQTSFEAERTAFHARYRVSVNQPPLDFVEVVTPFRRVVMAAEARVRAAERLLGQRDAIALLGDTPNQLELRLDFTFHPQNTFVGIPFYDVELTSVETLRTVVPARVERMPRFGPRTDGGPASTTPGGLAPGAGQPLVGGALVVVFGEAEIDASLSYVLAVREEGRTVARTLVHLGALR